MSKTISLIKITKDFGGNNVLSDVSLKLKDRERMCIVGENGAGKSTLLKILVGEIEPDEGSVVRSTNIVCHYVPQEFDPKDAEGSVQDFLEKYTDRKHFKDVFAFSRTLGYDIEKVLEKKCSTLSGGQQKILALSVALSVHPDFLLLDEPENHLDIVSRLALVQLLEQHEGGVVFISHDRQTVDAVAHRVTEVARGSVHISEGGFQKYLEARATRMATLQRMYDAEASRIRQIESSLSILQQKAIRGKGTSQYHARKNELEELKEKHAQGRPEIVRTAVQIGQKHTALHDGRLICRVEDISFTYPGAETPIFKDTSLEMRTGSHIILLGRNGAGKSTFLKTLMKKLPLSQGSVSWVENTKIAYFDQHAELDPKKSALETVASGLKVDDQTAYQALGAMKFSRERMGTKVGNLSGGERMRIRFAMVFGASPTFILLDEPTNHLDEVTWEILLEAVNDSPSTILLVTHDYKFIEGVKEKIFWLMHKNTIEERNKSLEQLVKEIS